MNAIFNFVRCLRAVWALRGYRPQPVTFSRIRKWVNQFDRADRSDIIQLLSFIRLISEDEVKKFFVSQNQLLLKRLYSNGLKESDIIYMQVGDAGSSSPLMLNLLRDSARIDKKNFHFLDSKNAGDITALTYKIGNGAIIYVDDFLGTGNQFCKFRKFTASYILGNFSEFILAPCVCEEAVHQLGSIGVNPIIGKLHPKSDRPLHESCTLLRSDVKERLRALCRSMHPTFGLGYDDLATMVILYRNAPNSLPLLFRGSQDQVPRCGVLPRISDLPQPAIL